MKLLVQPDDAGSPILKAIEGAKKSIEVAIFRFDRKDIERALVDAVKRGVSVQALIASTNRGGEKTLRGLETRLLGAGAIVARTADDLCRYHGKFMIIDRRKLYVLAFNFTRSDLDLSRSFGIMTTNPRLVQEAVKLFTADTARQLYRAGLNKLLVSPVNARAQLAEFLKGAKREALIYDPEVSDKAMLKLLRQRAEAGVEIRVIGDVKPDSSGIAVRCPHPRRLHARMIIRDRQWVFLGSQSLRRAELDLRREVGVIFRDRGAAARLAKIFELDWESAKTAEVPAEKIARKVAKVLTRELPPVAPVLEHVAAKNGRKLEVDSVGLKETIHEAVKTAVREAVHDVVTQGPTTKQ